MSERDLKVEKQAKRLLKKVDPVSFGQRLRRLREQQGLSIRTLATMASINKMSLVRIEAGNPAYVSTILKICEALGIHLERLCQPEQEPGGMYAIHHAEEDRWFDLQGIGSDALAEGPLSIEERQKFAKEGHMTQMLMLSCRPHASKILPGVIELYEPTKSRSHPGEEFIYVLDGQLTVTIGEQRHEISAGEAIGFWPSEPHHYGPSAGSKLPVRFLCIRVDR